MSPRNPPLPLQQVPPGTPSQSHAIPPIIPPPHPPVSHPPPTVTSPPPTPSVPSTRPTSLSANAGAFVPGKKISIKHPSGQEVNIESLKRVPPLAVPPAPPSPPSVKKDIKRPPIRIESQEQKEKRLAEEKSKDGESDEKTRPNDLVSADEDAARREIEEHELRLAEERNAKEEADRAEKERKEAEDRAALEEKERKEAEERAVREEAERKEAEERAAREAREKEERENERLRLEEVARVQREALEIAEKERAEQERLRKLQEEEELRAKDEAERQRKAEEDAAEASVDANLLADNADSTSLPEEGEVEDDVSQPAAAATEELDSANKGTPVLLSSPATHVLAELPAKPLEKEPLRIDTSLPSPEHQRRRPDPLNLQATINSNIAPPLPSALATARHIEDINRITYPQGIKSPRVELNVNTQKGKFRYVLTIYVFARFLLMQFRQV